MPRYVVFLRGVSPLNAKMTELRRCFEAAGFANVKTLLGSGNVILDSTARSDAAVERSAEKAMQAGLDRVFHPIVRSTRDLRALIDADPFRGLRIPSQSKRIVSFLRETPNPRVALPLSEDGASVLCVRGREILTAYVPSAEGPVFMKLIERAFGKEITTRTWDTVRKCADA